jgi:hypothetical protein
VPQRQCTRRSSGSGLVLECAGRVSNRGLDRGANDVLACDRTALTGECAAGATVGESRPALALTEPPLAVAAPGDEPAPRANESIEGALAVRLPVRAVSFLVVIIRLVCAQCTTVLRHPQQDAEGGVPLLPYAGT